MWMKDGRTELREMLGVTLSVTFTPSTSILLEGVRPSVCLCGHVATGERFRGREALSGADSADETIPDDPVRST